MGLPKINIDFKKDAKIYTYYKLIKNLIIAGEDIKIDGKQIANDWVEIETLTFWKLTELNNKYIKLKSFKNTHDIEITIDKEVFKEYFRKVISQ